MTDNEHIREYLNYYCSLLKEPQYAVLLTGQWGSGKTWFVENFIEKHLPQPERVLYVSLYGLQTFDDIDSEFFRLLHPVLGSKAARVLGRLTRGLLKTTINFDLNEDGNSDGEMSTGVPAEKILDKVSLKSSHILIFDDVERCSIPVASLLGYINQFVEHGGVKAILIANEGEFQRCDQQAGGGYSRIKEKLIGRAFEVVPEIRSALEHFAADLPSEKAREVIRANFPLITQVYECSEYKNLRLVRHALLDFDRIFRSLKADVLRYDLLVADLLALFLTYFFEVGSGTIKPHEIGELQNGWTRFLTLGESQSELDQRLHDVHRKYSGLNLYTSLIGERVWETIFATGSIPCDDLNESLFKSKYFQNEKQPNWVKFWYGADLTDEDFSEVLENVEAEWEDFHYQAIGEVIHVTGLFVRYAKAGILKRTVDEVIQSAKEYIDNLKNKGLLPILKPNARPSPFERDSYAGLSFVSLDEGLFQEFLTYIEEQCFSVQKSSLPIEAENLLKLIKTDEKLFLKRIILNNDPENFYYKTPILHLISPADFVRCMLAILPKDRRTVAYALRERYTYNEFNKELLPELDWLKKVACQLQSEIQARSGKISSLSLKWIVDSGIAQAISRLEQVELRSVPSSSATVLDSEKTNPT